MAESPLLAEFLRAGHGRAAPDLGGARAGHTQLARCGAGAVSISSMKRKKRPNPTRTAPRSDWQWPAGRMSASRRSSTPGWVKSAWWRSTSPALPAMRSRCRSSATASEFELIDTAGLRRKGKVFEAIEKFSVVKTLQAIADANVVAAVARCHARRDRAGRAHCRVYPRERPGRGAGHQQMGRGRRLTRRKTLQRSIESAAGVSEVRARCCTSRPSSGRASARCGRRSAMLTRRPPSR